MDIKSICADNHKYISKSDVMEWLFERRKTLEWYYDVMKHVTHGGGGETYGKIEMINEILKMLKDV